MPALDSILRGIRADRGLSRSIPDRQIDKGLRAADTMNDIIAQVVGRVGINEDGMLSVADMTRLRAGTYADKALYVAFFEAHGNDNGDVTTGYHNIQNDGGTLEFQGRSFINSVADGIYHFGFRIKNDRYYNEDGASNETVTDVAGWLNYFLNGENVVWGSAKADELGSGTYSAVFAAARSETFLAGSGADRVWADVGNDRVNAGTGNDTVGGGTGNDRIEGGTGADALWGEAGRDRILGGDGDDEIGGGTQGDILLGGAGDDTIYGDDGNDRIAGEAGDDVAHGGAGRDAMEGGTGADSLSGSEGDDRVQGGEGRDTLAGGNGLDRLRGGAGADLFQMWEDAARRDTLIFAPGDSGRDAGQIDRVEGFDPGSDKLDLTAFGPMRFAALDFLGQGRASAYFDGTYLRIDGTGDGATDMLVEFAWVESLTARDLILA